MPIPAAGPIISAIVAASLLASGCSVLDAIRHAPACEGWGDAQFCHEALEAAAAALPDPASSYALSVSPLACDETVCTTWVIATASGEECRPGWEVEVTRRGNEPWLVASVIHGDPPCAFE